MFRILIFNFIVYVMFNFGHPVTPEMLIEKNVYNGLNSIMFGFFALSSFLFSPYWGKYINLNGVKKILIFMPLFYAFAQLLLCFGETALVMIFARFISGIFAVAFVVAVSSYVNYVSDNKNKARNFGYIMVTSSLGGIVGQLFIGQLSVQIEGYYFAFILQVILGFVFIFIGYFLLEDKFSEVKISEKVKLKFSSFNVTIILLSTAITMYTSNIGYYITQQLGATSNQVGQLNAINSFIILMTNLFLIKIIENKLSSKTTFNFQIIGGIISMLIVIISLYYNLNFLIIIALLLFITSLSIFRPLAQKRAVNNSLNPNVDLGYINACNSLGMVIGSFLAGISYSINPNLPFVIITITLITSLTIFNKEKHA